MGKEIRIDLEDVIFRFKVGGKEYELQEPTIEQIEKYSMDDGASESTMLARTKDLLAELGLPKDVSAKMPARHIKKIFEAIRETNEDTKKK